MLLGESDGRSLGAIEGSLEGIPVDGTVEGMLVATGAPEGTSLGIDEGALEGKSLGE